MNARVRLMSFGAAMLVAATACNAILGITDLEDPTKSDSGGALADAPGAGDSSELPPDAATPDGPAAPCGMPVAPDPCMFEDPQTGDGGAVYPTWIITSDLPFLSFGGSQGTPTTPSYSAVDGGAVIEAHSQLTWQTAYANGGATMDLPTAMTTCQNIGPGWRVPTRIEAATLQHREQLSLDAGNNVTCVPAELDRSALSRSVWTSTPAPSPVSEPTEPHYYADEVGCNFNTAPKATALSVRCVKGERRSAKFVVSKSALDGGGTVHSLDTKLEWERTGVVVQSYAQALKHCEDLHMRLPVIQEAHGIIDTRTVKLFSDVLFVPPTAPPRILFSQTVFYVSPDPDSGAPVNGYEAIGLQDAPLGGAEATDPVDRAVDLLVRCVRGPL